jgi:hypothetical protein
MAVSEERRHELYLGLESLLGRERATTMMEMLPPVGWADVATRRDLAHHELVLRAELEALGSTLRAEMASLRSEVQGEIASLRSEVQGEIASLRGEVQGEIASLRGEVQGEIASLRSDVRSLEVEVGRVGDRVLGVLEARINDALVSQTRWVVGSVLATFVAFAGLVLGIAR